MVVEAHADLLDNLSTETSARNGALNAGAEDALRNTRLLTAQIRDDARQGSQQVATEVVTKAPETATTALGVEIYNFRTELSSYGAGVRTKINELDASCKTSLTALPLLHQEASLEMNNLQTAFNESNSKVATRFQEISKLIADLDARPQRAAHPMETPKEPS